MKSIEGGIEKNNKI